MPKEVQRQKKIMVQRAMLLNIFLREKPKVLADFSGMGVIRRIWITFDGLDDKNIAARILNSVSIQMYWDHEDRPSVDVPVGNFFLISEPEP